MYTHKRNIHNVISVSKKQGIFKRNKNSGNESLENVEISSNVNENLTNMENASKNRNFSYKSIAYGMSISSNFFDHLENKLQKIIKEFYLIYKDKLFLTENPNEKNIFELNLSEKNLNNSQGNCQHIFIEFLKKYKVLFSQKITIPSPHSGINIDEIFTIYIILFSRVTNSEKLLEKILWFILLFREFINSIGWDFYERNMLREFEKIQKNLKLFSQNDFIDYLPDFINEFLDQFLFIDENKFGFSENLSEIEDLAINFFNWLFNNNFTNLKISKVNFTK